ncbi:hypothetical protein DVH05_005087 [Phytophthora capsici]|nr:hypothetical protein DVH05_005087 [Phytophthora capsici]
MGYEQLPEEIIEVICEFLSGFNAFQLSHVDSWWMNFLSDGLRWHNRLVYGSVPENQLHLLPTWKRRYLLAKSMLFKGLNADDNGELGQTSCACIEFPPPTECGRFCWRHFSLRALHVASFSFDLWFCLLPAENDDQYAGGVIYGLQSEERDSGIRPKYHQQFIAVDSKRTLYTSVLDVKKPVASDLKDHRWYHIALSYDREQQHQDVYIDGKNIWSAKGALHREWYHLVHEQVGTGYITAGGDDFPHPDFVGWYGFNGILDEFRFWNGTLSAGDAYELARGGVLSRKRLCGTLKYPGLRGPQSGINVEMARCTRPAEGRAVELLNHSPRLKRIVT